MHTPKFLQRIRNVFSWKQLMFFWYRHYKGMFFCGFLVVLCLGGYFWYRNLYQYEWDGETKKAFVEQHFKETRFKERAFEDVVSHLKERAVQHKKEFLLSQDIFSGKSLR